VNPPRGFVKSNSFVIAAILLPLVVVGFFLLASALPRWTVPPPAYDLVIRVGKPFEQPPPRVAVEFRVADGRLEAVVRPVGKNEYAQPWAVFRLDHQTLNLDEIPIRLPDELPEGAPAQTIAVDAFGGRRMLGQARAPDGYELRTETSRGGSGLFGELFGMRGYDSSVAIVNRGRVITLPLPAGYAYLSPVSAIGWISEAR
jgi:hypothetical protein